MRQRLAVATVVQAGFFPMGRSAPEFKPRDLPPESVLNVISETLRRMDAAITECELRFGSSVRIADHPIIGPLTAREWRKFH